jgi:predicted metal-dependent peptidase
MQTHKFTEIVPTPDQVRKLEIARVGMMTACHFYSHFFYSQCREVFTRDVPTAATDGRHIFINPDYIDTLKPGEAIFVYAHEVVHAVERHPARGKHYEQQGTVMGKPFVHQFANVCADYVINAGLIEDGVGQMNPEWLYAADVSADEVWEKVYERKWQDPPPQPNNGGQGNPSTYRSSDKAPKGAKGDAQAAKQGGAFDELLDPPVDPVTGKVDLPSDTEYKEAIAAAAAAAKAMGKLPTRIARMVEDILEPQIQWRDKIRLTITGMIGRRKETWNRPDRRKLILNPIIMMPGRTGHGADTVAVVVDTSGSIYADPKALGAFFGEMRGILADVKPKTVILIECDAQIRRVAEANSLDELEVARKRGVRGGGGTSFVPPFEYLEKEGIKPDALIYLTDLQGQMPDKAPLYPVVWASIEKGTAPFGETVYIKT